MVIDGLWRWGLDVCLLRTHHRMTQITVRENIIISGIATSL
jgi:hypothetical protein